MPILTDVIEVYEMEEHLLQRIEMHAASFSKGQRRIADYIGENYDQAAGMTASKIGKTVGVSENKVHQVAGKRGDAA